MKFIKFHTNIFYGQLQHVPEPRQILGGGPWMSIGIQVFFTQFSELVEFLGHEKLGTAHCGSDFP